MKNFKLNKKGFTLVELLAVIVILALLIVITANTVLPMMNKSRANAMVVYAERVLNTASASYQADSITTTTGTGYYSIAKLMGEDNYYGCVSVTQSGESYTYQIAMIDAKNGLAVYNKTISSVTSLSDTSAESTATTGNYTTATGKITSADSVKEHTGCKASVWS